MRSSGTRAGARGGATPRDERPMRPRARGLHAAARRDNDGALGRLDRKGALVTGGGSIITTSSVEGLFGEMMAAPYCTAKAAVINLTRTVAIEYGRRGIRANCICPGAVDTPMLALLCQVSGRSKETMGAQHAIGRVLRPEELANVALFLASDESSAVTGAALVADGGLTAGLGITGFPPYGG